MWDKSFLYRKPYRKCILFFIIILFFIMISGGLYHPDGFEWKKQNKTCSSWTMCHVNWPKQSLNDQASSKNALWCYRLILIGHVANGRDFQAKSLHGVLWPLRLLCCGAGGTLELCDAEVSIIEKRGLPAVGLLCGSGEALCGRGEIDEEHQGKRPSTSPSVTHSQLGSLHALPQLPSSTTQPGAL